MRAGMHGGTGRNTLRRAFLEKYNLPISNRDKFVKGLEYAKAQKVDIFLGNHVDHNHTDVKLARVAQGETDAFVTPEEWIQYLENKIRAVAELD